MILRNHRDLLEEPGGHILASRSNILETGLLNYRRDQQLVNPNP